MLAKRILVILIALILVSGLVLTAGCATGGTTAGSTAKSTTAAASTAAATTTRPASSVTTAGTTAVGTTTAKPGATTAPTATTAATTAAPPLKKGGDAFQKLIASAVPVFTDTFADKKHVPDTINSPFYKQTVASTRNVTYVDGQTGNGVRLDGYDSYVGYPAGIVKASEGTIRFAYRPEANIYASYNERQGVWKDYGSIAPPFTGFMIDTVGWNSAFRGGYTVSLTFRKGDSGFSHLSFGTWSGSNWAYTQAELTPTIRWESGKWYDIIIAYSRSKGMNAVYIDGYLAGTVKFNTDLSQTEGFFIGQGPWKNSMEYWPYGPHALKGTYSNLRIYDQALME